ncbi:hypothetical protein FQN49_007981 [Arthroderma sp. PD_2]|nr:hypothetical protein FQN49_007981 [Arthroderma sp. PD_2]
MPLPKNAYISDVWKDGVFDNKVVFCTGGSGTICSAQVRALVHLGANACIVGRNVEKTENMAKDIATARAGSKVLGIGSVDVRSFESVKKAVDRCVEELGSVDFVIAGAAGNFLASINQLSVNAFKAVMDIDVQGSYNTLKATVPHLVESAAKHKSDGVTSSPTGTGGRIIFVSATIHYTGLPMQTHVSVAKAGVDALSNSVALEFGPLGVTSNVISPGPIGDTEGVRRLARDDAKKQTEAAIPLGRYGSVKEIADATIYLFSDSGNFVNGSTVVVDGGAWRLQAAGISGSSFRYPDFLLSGHEVTGVSGLKKSKI